MTRFWAIADDLSRVWVALISVTGTAFGALLVYRRRMKRDLPLTQAAVEDAGAVRRRQLAEAWAEYATHMEERLRVAERAFDDCREGVRTTEEEYLRTEARYQRELLTAQAKIEMLQTEVLRLRAPRGTDA